MNKVKSIKKKTSSARVTSEKHWRIYGLTGLVFFMAVCMIVKLYILQISQFAMYNGLAENQHDSTTAISAKRGEIFLQDDDQPYPIAVNREMQMVYAVPREMKDPASSIDTLASILSLDKDFLNSKLDNPDDMFEILKHKLSDDEAQQIKDAKIAGIYLQPEEFRYYPAGQLAAQVVGFVGSNGGVEQGMYGLEASWENTLHGQDGSLQQEGDSQGRWIPVTDRNVQAAKDGPDLILTINHTVQFEVEKILQAAIDRFQADSGTVVVMDPKTGKILAMANQPSFDPNNFSQVSDISVFNNPAVNEPYEPGSVFKVFTESMGLETGKITPTSTYTDAGVVRESGYDIRNASTDPFNGYGVQTMTQVLEKSLNTGVIYIEKLVGNKLFNDYVTRFGFGQKTGIELPGELAGNVHNLDNTNSNISYDTASFGQGITTTPIQLAAAYGAIANGGMLMKPYIVDKQNYSDGTVQVTQPQEVRQVVSASTAQQAGAMLRDVVMNGNGKRADVPGYQVVGKTGTAQVAKAGGGGYQDGVTIGSFAGFAPLNDPQFVVVVKIVNPKAVQWAESSAAPTSGEIMKFLLQYYNVKPTEDPATSPLAHLPPLQIPLMGPVSTTTPTPVAPQANDGSKKNNQPSDGAKVITSGD